MKQYRASFSAFSNIFATAKSLSSNVGVSLTAPRITSRQVHRCNIPVTQQMEHSNPEESVSSLDSNDEHYSRISIFNPFVDYLITELSDRFACHRSNVFPLQILVPKYCWQYESIHLQPIYDMYKEVLPGCLSELEA